MFLYPLLIILLCAFWPRGHLLFFASPKQSKQKKGDPGYRFAAQTSLTAHAFGGARVSLRSGSPLFPPKQAQRSFCEVKTMFRSAAPRGWLHGLCVSGSLNRIACKLLHFYSSVQLQLLKIPIRQTAKLRRCFRLGICLRRYDRH